MIDKTNGYIVTTIREKIQLVIEMNKTYIQYMPKYVHAYCYHHAIGYSTDVICFICMLYVRT